jgi:hypothetical protein
VDPTTHTAGRCGVSPILVSLTAAVLGLGWRLSAGGQSADTSDAVRQRGK